MAKVMIMDHPLIQHKLTILRNEKTGSKEFRALVSEIATLICYEATRDLPLKDTEIKTPVAVAKTKVLAGKKLAFVPILRAGLGMVDGVLALVPSARVGHIGLYRDPETLMPVEYYCKLPADIEVREVIVLDPMLATGGSAIDAITQIKKRNPKDIKFMGIIAAPEGLAALQKAHPDVDIYVAALDDHLNAPEPITRGYFSLLFNRRSADRYANGRNCFETFGKYLQIPHGREIRSSHYCSRAFTNDGYQFGQRRQPCRKRQQRGYSHPRTPDNRR